MSEQEKKSGGGTGSPVVLVEQSMGSRHKPFRPVDMQEDTPPSESHHKRSKAPAVPSLAEELKDNVNPETKDRKESVPAEKFKHNVAKKLSMTKRRESSPETITLASMNVEMKKDIKPSQPIPSQVSSVSSAEADHVTKKDAEEKNDENDSITEEIAELRTPEVAKITSEWTDKYGDVKKKEVSWNEEDYLDKVKLKDNTTKSQACVLERKSSIGPCYRAAAPFGRPSGISICLAKKSVSTVVEEYDPKKSVININVSKKCLINKTIYRPERDSSLVKDQIKDVRSTIINKDAPKAKFLGAFRQGIANMSDKITKIFE